MTKPFLPFSRRISTLALLLPLAGVGAQNPPAAVEEMPSISERGFVSGSVSASIDAARPVEFSGYATEGAVTYVIRDGKVQPLTEEIVLRIRPDGKVIGFNGETLSIPSGMMLTTDGRLVQRPNGLASGSLSTGVEASQNSPTSATGANGMPGASAGGMSGESAITSGQRGGATLDNGNSGDNVGINSLDQGGTGQGGLNQSGLNGTGVNQGTTTGGTSGEAAQRGQPTTDSANSVTGNPRLGSPGTPSNVDPNDPSFGTSTVPNDSTGRGTSQSVTEDTATQNTGTNRTESTGSGDNQATGTSTTGSSSDSSSSGTSTSQGGSSGSGTSGTTNGSNSSTSGGSSNQQSGQTR